MNADDAALVSRVAERLANDSGERTDLEDVLAMFGLTRAELEAELDDV